MDKRGKVVFFKAVKLMSVVCVSDKVINMFNLNRKEYNCCFISLYPLHNYSPHRKKRQNGTCN